MKTTLMRLASLSICLLSLLMLASGCNESYGNKVVSADEGRLTISDAEGQDYKTHEVAADATITVDGKPAKLDELKSGDTVNVKVENRDGLDVATEITASTSTDLAPEVKTPTEQPATTPPVEADATTSTEPEKPNATTQPPEETSPTQPSTAPVPAIDETVPSPPSPEAAAPSTEGTAPSTESAAAPEATEGSSETPSDDSLQGKIASMGDNQFAVKDDGGTDHMITVNSDTKYTLDGEAASFADLAMDQMVTAIGQKDGDKLVAKSVAATTK